MRDEGTSLHGEGLLLIFMISTTIRFSCMINDLFMMEIIRSGSILKPLEKCLSSYPASKG